MKKYPDWVPEAVLRFFESLPEGSGYSKAPIHYMADRANQLDIEVLAYAIEDPEMEPAWKAIARRGNKVPPERFAKEILDVSYRVRHMDRYPTVAQIDAHRRMAKRARVLLADLRKNVGSRLQKDWRDPRVNFLLKRNFHTEPLDALQEFAEYLDLTARDMEETRTELTAYVGKTGDKNAKRVYVIRLLSSAVKAAYSQPLHNVVARTSAVILDEQEIDPDLVRKLVKLGENLEPPYWAG